MSFLFFLFLFFLCFSHLACLCFSACSCLCRIYFFSRFSRIINIFYSLFGFHSSPSISVWRNLYRYLFSCSLISILVCENIHWLLFMKVKPKFYQKYSYSENLIIRSTQFDELLNAREGGKVNYSNKLSSDQWGEVIWWTLKWIN